MHKIPDRPNWAPLLIVWKGNIVTSRILVKLPLEFGRVPCTGIVSTCIWFLEVICESRGLSNLTPSRSRLFKLKVGKGGSEAELHQALAYMVANLRK